MSDSESFAQLLDQFAQSHPGSGVPPKVGDEVEGILVSIDEDVALVDLGSKTEGRLEVAALKNAAGELQYTVGDTVRSRVTGRDEETGMLLLGAQHSQRYQGIHELEQAYRQGLAVTAQVTGAVKGGLEVQVAGIRGFCPASQADIGFIEDLSGLVGQRLEVKITKIEGGKRPNLVVSRRALLEEAQRQLAAETRAKLVEGAVLTGRVTSIMDYGAFVDIGGLEGMIHISELAFGHIKHPKEVLEVGQCLEVGVLRVEPPSGERKREKIALSLRALSRNPWLDAAERFPVGAVVEGKVSKLQTFGAFIELVPGIEGLVHISELGAGRRVAHPSEVLELGTMVTARVLAVDLERRRLSLSLEQSRQDLGADSVRDTRASAAAKVSAAPAEKTLGSFGELLKARLDERGQH